MHHSWVWAAFEGVSCWGGGLLLRTENGCCMVTKEDGKVKSRCQTGAVYRQETGAKMQGPTWYAQVSISPRG